MLRQSIDADRFPLSPRVLRWKELLAKLDPERPAAAEPYPPGDQQHDRATEAEPVINDAQQDSGAGTPGLTRKATEGCRDAC